MPQAPLVEILRYAASGFLLLLYLYVANPELAKSLRTNLGDATIALSTFIVGALTYIVYRVVIFGHFVAWIRDLRPTYRTWLRKEYKLASRYQAILLYGAIRPMLRQSSERATHFANVHYGYMASLFAFVFFVVAVYSKEEWREWRALVLYVSGIVLLLATLAFHKRGEDEELLELRLFAYDHPDTIRRLAAAVRHYPEFPEFLSNRAMLIPAAQLFAAIRRTQPTRPATGVCLEGDSELRLAGTVALFRAKEINHIIVSGGVKDPSPTSSDRLSATAMRERLSWQGIPADVIEVDERSMSTHDHPLHVNVIAREHGFTDLMIITSGYHLLRAYLRFLRILIDQGYPYHLYGYPVGTGLNWIRRSRSEGRYRILNLSEELTKIRTYHGLATFKEALQYISTLQQARPNG